MDRRNLFKKFGALILAPILSRSTHKESNDIIIYIQEETHDYYKHNGESYINHTIEYPKPQKLENFLQTVKNYLIQSEETKFEFIIYKPKCFKNYYINVQEKEFLK